MKNIVIITIATIITFGGIYLIVTKSGLLSPSPVSESNSSENTQTIENGSETPTIDEDPELNEGLGSISSLLLSGSDLQCDFYHNDTENEVQSTGTIFISDGKLRVDTEITDEGNTYQANMIDDGIFIYTWTENNETNVALKLNKADFDPATESMNEMPQFETPIEYNKDINYNCLPWSPNQNVFVPPSGLQFIDPAEMLSDFDMEFMLSQ